MSHLEISSLITVALLCTAACGADADIEYRGISFFFGDELFRPDLAQIQASVDAFVAAHDNQTKLLDQAQWVQVTIVGGDMCYQTADGEVCPRGLYNGWRVTVLYTECLADSTLIHELSHWAQEEIHDRPRDLAHTDPYYWSADGSVATAKAAARKKENCR